MGNMGVSELRLVNPVDFLVEEARVRSADNEDILANAAVYESMEAAIGGLFIRGGHQRPGPDHQLAESDTQRVDGAGSQNQ